MFCRTVNIKCIRNIILFYPLRKLKFVQFVTFECRLLSIMLLHNGAILECLVIEINSRFVI